MASSRRVRCTSGEVTYYDPAQVLWVSAFSEGGNDTVAKPRLSYGARAAPNRLVALDGGPSAPCARMRLALATDRVGVSAL